MLVERSDIEDFLRKTFEFRQGLRNQKATAAELLENFSKLLDFEGDMVQIKISNPNYICYFFNILFFQIDLEFTLMNVNEKDIDAFENLQRLTILKFPYYTFIKDGI